MKTLERQFTDQELEMIAMALSQFSEHIDEDLKPRYWKMLWRVQQYFNEKFYQVEETI